MKKLLASLFIALVLVGGIPSVSFAKTNVKTANIAADVIYDTYRVRANSTNTHRIYLRKGAAAIGIEGDGDTDLDLYVYDSNRLIAKMESHSDEEMVRLNIYRSGYFTVRVVNRGSVYNDYLFGYAQ